MTEKRYRVLVFLGALALVIAVIFGNGAMRDNSDYSQRILLCTGLMRDSIRSDFTYLLAEAHLPSCRLGTPIVAVVGALRMAASMLHRPSITIGFTSGVFVVLWFAGLIVTLRHPMAWRVPWALPSLLLVTMVFSGFFRSFYEELNILVLLPLLLLGFWRWQQDGKPLVLLVTLCLITFSKVQMVGALPFLFLLVWAKIPSWRAAALMTVSALIVSLFSLWRWDHTTMNTPNVYDRFYNGIGMALQDVGDWPIQKYPERHHYFSLNQERLQAMTQAYETDLSRPLMGTSYYSWGYDMRRDLIKQGREAAFAQVLAPGSLANMMGWFLRHPQLWPKLATQVAKVTFKSDYRLKYMEGPLSLPGLDLVRKVLRFWGGAVVLGAVALIAVLRRRIQIPLIYLVSLPAAVWLGSGFFEFEKHIVPYWMLLPLLIGVTYSDNWGRRRLAARPN